MKPYVQRQLQGANRLSRTAIDIVLRGIFVAIALTTSLRAEDPPKTRVYENRLTPIQNPAPLLADYPEFVQPIVEVTRYEAPRLVDDERADLNVRAWRFSYNARGIIEMPNRLRADQTAVIMVHPWGIDDGQGWRTPEPAGVADFCTPTKNHLAGRHTHEVVDPLLKRLRPHVAFTMFSIRAGEQEIHRKLYRSIRHTPNAEDRSEGRRQLHDTLHRFKYEGQPLPSQLTLSNESPVIDYFRQFPGLDAGDRYNNVGFWSLPVPVCHDVTMDDNDIVVYDDDGYPPLRDFLKQHGVRHVLLTGYATDMCFCKTTAGYENLSRDFNVFLVGDASLATFPANDTPRYATNAHISFASLNQLITQVSWIRHDTDTERAKITTSR
ncbi:MAG: isochorismatase family protein [Planctomycetota bacterium]|nr:isochorismatase family protein [Planctomycetota bacterium]MDA1178694.1 isochorismatase family protein [Planctomycetota bacterium]